MLAKFWREYITQRSYWYTAHRLPRHIQDILLDETSNMLKRRTVRTWRNIMISNCTPVCTVSLELRLDLFFNFVQRAGQGVQAWTMVHKFSSTDGIASCHGPGSQTYSFIPSSSELLAVSSLAWQVWHSGVSGSLFLFYFVCCSHQASYKIGTYPPCNWAKHSWWKAPLAGDARRIFLRHHFVIGVCLVQTITSWRGTFLLLQQILNLKFV